MLEKLRNIFQVPELKRRILFTLGLFVVYRLGEHVPTPGVNAKALAGAFAAQAGTLFGLYDLFVGGAFSRATVFALGIMPYISASIIIQLLGAVVPYFEKLRKEGEEGQKKLTQYTRYGTVAISIVQSFAYSVFLLNMGASSGVTVVPHPGPVFTLSTIITQDGGNDLRHVARREDHRSTASATASRSSSSSTSSAGRPTRCSRRGQLPWRHAVDLHRGARLGA
jgi:preprotein translocase subunit SecY